MLPVKLASGQTYGRSLSHREVGRFRLLESTYPPGYRTPIHSHERPLFCFVVNGSYSETYGTHTRVCEPATVLFHPEGEIHAERFHERGGRSFVIELDAQWLSAIRQARVAGDGPTEFRGGMAALLARRLYKEFSDFDDVSPVIIEGLMLEMIGETKRQALSTLYALPKMPRWLRQAKELVQDRFAERLTLAEIARDVGVHPTHLAETFRRTFSCTVGDYVRRLRVEYACREIATSDTPLVMIALAAGFSDQSHFTRTFKSYTGVAPSEYRQAISDRS